MAIPRISRANVLSAIRDIQRKGVPPPRRSTKYFLVHEGCRYPPKYVVSLAVKDATERALDPQEFGGGAETNSILRQLGFSIVTLSGRSVGRQRRVLAFREGGGIPPRKAVLEGPSPESTARKPLVGRVVVVGQKHAPSDGEALLLDVLRSRWPEGLHLKFLITPGGFVHAPFPKDWSGGTGWTSLPTDLRALRIHAERALSKVVSDRVLRAAEGKVDVLTVGIDLYAAESRNHAELVAVYEFAQQRVFWTGKSYPTSDQEHHLVQVVELGTHLVKVAGERVLVLGCHDLNMFSPRGWASQARRGARRERCRRMRELARQFRPTVVLQHPHTTDSPNIWRTAWAGVSRQLPGLKAWASSIRYHYHDGGRPRAELRDVLVATRGATPTVDFISSPKPRVIQLALVNKRRERFRQWKPISHD